MSDDVQPLDYAPAPPMARQRRWMRWGAKWGGLALLLVLAMTFGPRTWRQAWYLRAQQKCLTHIIPADQLAYANDPADATPLLAAGYKAVASVAGTTTKPAAGPTMSAGRTLPPLAEVGEETLGYYARSLGGYLRQGVANAPVRTGAFLHERTDPASGPRLIAVVFLERQNNAAAERQLEINGLVWRPATWALDSRLELSGLTTLVLTGLDHHRVRIFAGQADPLNPAHFTIPYEIDGKPGIIDGWLNAYEQVLLQVRSEARNDPEH